jgi:hypothetical protein
VGLQALRNDPQENIGPNSLKDFAEVVLRMGKVLLARQRRHPREAARHQQPRVAGDDGRQAG